MSNRRLMWKTVRICDSKIHSLLTFLPPAVSISNFSSDNFSHLIANSSEMWNNSVNSRVVFKIILIGSQLPFKNSIRRNELKYFLLIDRLKRLYTHTCCRVIQNDHVEYISNRHLQIEKK